MAAAPRWIGLRDVIEAVAAMTAHGKKQRATLDLSGIVAQRGDLHVQRPVHLARR